MSTTDLNVGIVGAGHIAGVHARHLVRLPGVSLQAIADIHQERAVAMAQTYGAVGYDSLSTLLSHSPIDALIVCVPTESHPTVTEQAFHAGVHVLCEKPLALTTTDCDALIATANQTGKILTVGQVVRFFPEYANAKRLVEGGVVGKPASVRLRRCVGGKQSVREWYADPRRGGGVIYDLLVHEFDFLLWCFGAVSRVYAHSLTPQLANGTAPLDYALITLRHANGVVAHIEGCWGDPSGFSTAFEIAGDAGLLTHDSRSATTFVQTPVGEGNRVLTAPLYPEEDPYYRQLQAFVQTIHTGTIQMASATEGRAAVQIAEAATLSAQTGKAVHLIDGKKKPGGKRGNTDD
jgi:predicted dehydrogenase